MYFSRVHFANKLLAQFGVDGVRSIDARVNSMSRNVSAVSCIGSRFTKHLDSKKITHAITIVIWREFKTPHEAEKFEFSHTSLLGKLQGGNLRYQGVKKTYLAIDAQLSGITHERIGVSVKSTYSITCGKISSSWRLRIKADGAVKTIKVMLSGKEFYPLLDNV